MNTRWHLAAAAALVAVTIGLPATRPAAADTELPASFAINAAADTVRISTVIPGGVFSDGLADFSSGSAGAAIDSVGVSRAFAAAPYPGPAGTNLFDLLRGQTGAPLPSYPLIAASDYPAAPEGDVSQPALKLEARSGPGLSEATLATGADQGETGLARSVGRARVSIDDAGSLVAESTAELSGISAGPLVISKVASRARMVWPAHGQPIRERALEITGATVGGQRVGIGPDGVLAPSGTVPLPDGAPAWQALKQAGISVRYADAVDTPTGVVSAALLITQVVPTSPTGGQSTITYTIGRSRASVVVGAEPTASQVTSAPATSTTEATPPAVAGDAVEPAGDAARVPDGNARTIPDRRSVPSVAPPSAGAAAVPELTTSEPDVVPPEAATRRNEASMPVARAAPAGTSREARSWAAGAVYGSLLLSGGALLGALVILRRLGVRSTWGS